MQEHSRVVHVQGNDCDSNQNTCCHNHFQHGSVRHVIQYLAYLLMLSHSVVGGVVSLLAISWTVTSEHHVEWVGVLDGRSYWSLLQTFSVLMKTRGPVFVPIHHLQIVYS